MAPSRSSTGCASKITRSISSISPSDMPFEEQSSSTNCCDKYRARGNERCPFASRPSRARFVVLPPPQVKVTEALPRTGLARTKKDGLAFSCARQTIGDIASQPAAIISARAVFPDPRAPTIATRPGFRGISGFCAQAALVIDTWDITCDGIAERGGSVPTNARPSGSIHA
ncbi:hypothetical protein D3C86_1338600 [compost metagenome]